MAGRSSEPDPAPLVRARVVVQGLVQGVGFRPFVWRAATERGLAGWVSNSAAGVVLEVEGCAPAVDALLEALTRPPPHARVERIERHELPVIADVGFSIRPSDSEGAHSALISPDLPTCADCLRELHDPADRRFRYAFTNCTNCGPRYTITTAVPYDRSRTTMAAFALCVACQREYDDPADRRFHAEPVCCPSCGPQLQVRDRLGNVISGDPITVAAELLRAGEIVAVKGLGGYHIAVDAFNEQAVRRLRARKHREDRPFAVMVRDVDAAHCVGSLGPAELALLTGSARPIVVTELNPRTSDIALAASVAPGSRRVGLLLPYTPLHTLLLEAFGGPLVLTSGNVASEPIVYRDEDVAQRLAGVADYVLTHNRAIHTRVDDSVVAVVGTRELLARRSRGYVPQSILLPLHAAQPVLACGAALKNTFCLTRGTQAFVSHHIGDLENYQTMLSYRESISHLCRLFDIVPAVIAHDLHPDYPSTRFAHSYGGVPLVGVQHHHAHIVSCLVDNRTTGPVIGVAFDGLGFGDDGTAWGGEFLIADVRRYHRAAHLAAVPMPGGDAATRQPWRMAAAHLDAAYDGDIPAGLSVARRQQARWDQVLVVGRARLNAPLTTSAGRLFDAVAALIGVRDVVSYEGQAAIELEHVADRQESGSYPMDLRDDTVEVSHLMQGIVEDLRQGVSTAVIAARFHTALADMILQVCLRLRDTYGLATVALSGGVFQNSLLVARCLERLERQGFTVLTHRQVPCNDGGISLGQAAIGAAFISPVGEI